MGRLAAAAPLLVLAVTACATGAPLGGHAGFRTGRHQPFAPAALPRPVPPAHEGAAVIARAPRGGRDLAVELARRLVGQPNVELSGRRYPDDCTGLVRGVYEQLGLDLSSHARPGDNGVTAIYRFAAARGRVYTGGRPVAGDLAFFRETYDVNRDGRTNDGLTHVGLVESVLEDGTVLVIHRVSRGVVRYRMNLTRKDVHTDPKNGRKLNDYLRASGPGHAPVLTGQLFAAYATVLPNGPRHASR